MVNLLNEYKKIIEENKSIILNFTNPPDNIPTLESTLSNNDLLVSCLIKIYELDKAKYLPLNITSSLMNSIKDIMRIIQLFKQEPQNQTYFTDILNGMDKLYTLCLQYGLITFGFSGKEETQLIENVRNEIDEINSETKSLRKMLKTHKEKADTILTDFDQNIKQLKSDAQKRLNTFDEDLKAGKNSADDTVSKITGMLDVVNTHQNSVKTILDKITENNTNIQQALDRIKENEKQSQGILQNTATMSSKVNEYLQTVSTNVAEVKAKVDSANQSLANVKQKEKEISDFYQKLESYKAEMIEVKKKADADYIEIKTSCNSNLEKYNEEIRNLINQNKKYQEDIKDLLHKAVSAGLFSVFKQRQEFLAKGRKFWRWAVICSSILVAAMIIFVSWGWSTKPDIIFFVRLGVMIPLAFLMYFTAAQYRRERQAEEEYAFKSAISFSLEPYRDLLLRMRQSGELEADFVKKLMDDIFDNPVPRLYSKRHQKDESENLIDLLTELTKKIQPDKKNIILEAIDKFKKAFEE
jgi:uncharacterized coiled-coil DUF342 family protein